MSENCTHVFYTKPTQGNACKFCDVEMTDLEVMRYLDDKEAKRDTHRAFIESINFGGNFL